MRLDKVSSGRKLPDDFKVIIEIPAYGDSVDEAGAEPYRNTTDKPAF